MTKQTRQASTLQSIASAWTDKSGKRRIAEAESSGESGPAGLGRFGDLYTQTNQRFSACRRRV
jgi:hypothetical protein